MRAADKGGKHLCGAECIAAEEHIIPGCEVMIRRAARHSRGAAGEIRIKIERLDDERIEYIKALPVTTRETQSAREGRAVAIDILEKLNVPDAAAVFDRIRETFGMRGAMLLNADTGERLEPDPARGVRVTRMDAEDFAPASSALKEEKNHFREALVLATKAVHAPHIIGEICVSDDPDYVTGYVASKELGYIRITRLKESGEGGGRIFLYRGDGSEAPACIRYLQSRPVLVTNMPDSPQSASPQDALQKKWDGMRRALAELRKNHLYRSIPPIESAAAPHIRYQGRDLVLLASNDYLDLAGEPRVKAWAAEMGTLYGVGSGGSRLTTGSSPLHGQLEKMLAAFKGTEAALLFNTGYMANLGTISALCSKDWVIFSDEKNHASIIDGCRLSGAKIIVYKHNDMDDLEDKVWPYEGRKGLIVSDSVFSMDGDIVNLPRLCSIAEARGMYSMIDEAHATGVVGKTGRGVTEYYGVKPDIIIGTCSKALGSEGGFVCGNKLLIDFLVNRARSFIFSTALPANVVAAAIKALEILMNEPERVERLRENVRFFCGLLRDEGIAAASETAIIPIVLGCEEKALAVSRRLLDEGFYISAIRYPTVPKGKAMLRVVLMSSHTKEDLAATAKAIAAAIAG
ncbi:MAG: 6-carboxyhexanoate--CoA ligase, partial [Spirochaetales bacterium]|nr:6-carboxyhexanoate--CoA ligase [Spirochaetales bacterium]